MTIERIQDQRTANETPAVTTPQQEIQKEVLKQAMNGDNTQQQMLQLLATVQPMQQIAETAKNQISKGFLNIKV